MKNYFLSLLRRLNLFAHKEGPLASANTTNFMGRPVSDRLSDDGHWRMLGAANDPAFDARNPVGEAEGYGLPHYSLCSHRSRVDSPHTRRWLDSIPGQGVE